MPRGRKPKAQKAEASQPTETAQTEAPKEPKQYDNSKMPIEEAMNIGYVKDDKVKEELTTIFEALKAKTSVRVKKSSGHDMSVIGRDGKQVLKVCPLTKGWSADIGNGKVERPGLKPLLKIIDGLE